MSREEEEELGLLVAAQLVKFETQWGADIKAALDGGLDPDVLVAALVGYATTYAVKRGWKDAEILEAVAQVRAVVGRRVQ